MKLKTKLAEEYLSPHFINEHEGYDLTEEEIYLAGFEKAREMAQDRFINKVMVRPKHTFEPNTINTVVVNGDRFEFTLMEDFENLGEEEVNE